MPSVSSVVQMVLISENCRIHPALNTRLARATFSEDLRASRSRTTKKIPEPANTVRGKDCRIHPALNTRLARATFSEDLRASRSRTTKKIAEPANTVRGENCRIRPAGLIRPTPLLRSGRTVEPLRVSFSTTSLRSGRPAYIEIFVCVYLRTGFYSHNDATLTGRVLI